MMTRRKFLKALGLLAALPFIGLGGEDRLALPKTYADTIISYGPIDFWPLDEKELPFRPRYILTTKEHEATARAIIDG